MNRKLNDARCSISGLHALQLSRTSMVPMGDMVTDRSNLALAHAKPFHVVTSSRHLPGPSSLHIDSVSRYSCDTYILSL